MATMSDETASLGEVAVKMFGDPRSVDVYRGPERRDEGAGSAVATRRQGEGPSPVVISTEVPSVGLGRGDGFATFLFGLAVVVVLVTVVIGTLILFNARNQGAFRNPWDSTRVAIGLAVLAVGTIQSVLLFAASRIMTYLVVLLRLRTRDAANRRD